MAWDLLNIKTVAQSSKPKQATQHICSIVAMHILEVHKCIINEGEEIINYEIVNAWQKHMLQM